MKYIVLETYPEVRVMINPDTGLPYYFDYIDDALDAVKNCERGQVVRIEN